MTQDISLTGSSSSRPRAAEPATTSTCIPHAVAAIALDWAGFLNAALHPTLAAMAAVPG